MQVDADFIPSIWPEESVPSCAADCQKCELANQRARIIWGEGNPNAPVTIVLDNPGNREDNTGSPYVCGTRQTLQYGAYKSGLTMDDLYVTYLLKCRPVRRYNKETARSACLGYLLDQIRQQNPSLVFCLGNTALQWFLDDMSADVKNNRGVWRMARGFQTLVSYHPLAVRRRPNLMNQFLSDWQMLANRLNDLRN